MKPFWREQPLNDKEQTLLNAVFAAHDKSAGRQNISSQVLLEVATGSKTYTNSLAAALLSIGGVHAPIAETMEVLQSEQPALTAHMHDKVPGWGNSFHKGEPDPAWSTVANMIETYWPDMHKKMDSVTQLLKTKNLFPNPSAYTAATAIILGMPKTIAPLIFILGRISRWSEMYLAIVEGQV